MGTELVTDLLREVGLPPTLVERVELVGQEATAPI